jgi:hypothetical protein
MRAERKLGAGIFAIILLILSSAGFAQDPGIADTVRISDAVGQIFEESALRFSVDVTIYNDQELNSVVIPLLVDGNYGWVKSDSVSYVSSRLSDPSILDDREAYLFGSDSILHDSIILKFEIGSGDPLPAGDGVICKLWFRPIYGGELVVDSASFPSYGSLLFTTPSDEGFIPQFQAASIEIPCDYVIGDLRVNGVANAEDLLGINKGYLGCFGVDIGDPWHADVNCDHLTDIRDVYSLRDYIFYEGTLCNCGDYSPAYYNDPGIPDTVWIESDTLYVGHPDTIDVGIINDETLRGFALAIEWDGSAHFTDPYNYGIYDHYWPAERLLTAGEYDFYLESYDCAFSIDYTDADTLSAATWAWGVPEWSPPPVLSPGSGAVMHMVFVPETPGEVSMRLVNWNVYSYDFALTRGGESLLLAEDNAGIVPVVRGGHLVVLQYLCGDANGDLMVNVSDAVHIINYVFVGGAAPDPMESGDANCDQAVNVSDAVWIINYVFIGGNLPCDQDGDGSPDC